MELKVEDRGKQLKVVRVSENITFANVKEFQSVTQELVDAGVSRVLLDLAKVSFCNSHGFGAIINLYTRLAKRDGRFAILKPQKAIQEVLEITKMDSIIGVYEDEEEAVKALCS
jgi:anti-sigma B factor antagonist